MKGINIPLLILLIQITMTAQGWQKEQSSQEKIDTVMKQQIVKLKDGSLLVRLFTKKNTIDAMRKSGKEELAIQTEKEQAQFNLDIIASFHANYNFCPVYFFYNENSDSIKSKQFDKVIFLDDSLNPNPALKLKNNNFLIAEFGTIEQDTAKFYDDKYIVNTKQGPETKKSYHGGPDMRFHALKILSDQFVQLQSPFPYYVKTGKERPNQEKLKKVIVRMNGELNDFYKNQ